MSEDGTRNEVEEWLSLWKFFARNKQNLLYSIVLGGLAGVAVGFFIPKKYTEVYRLPMQIDSLFSFSKNAQISVEDAFREAFDLAVQEKKLKEVGKIDDFSYSPYHNAFVASFSGSAKISLHDIKVLVALFNSGLRERNSEIKSLRDVTLKNMEGDFLVRKSKKVRSYQEAVEAFSVSLKSIAIAKDSNLLKARFAYLNFCMDLIPGNSALVYSEVLDAPGRGAKSQLGTDLVQRACESYQSSRFILEELRAMAYQKIKEKEAYEKLFLPYPELRSDPFLVKSISSNKARIISGIGAAILISLFSFFVFIISHSKATSIE